MQRIAAALLLVLFIMAAGAAVTGTARADMTYNYIGNPLPGERNPFLTATITFDDTVPPDGSVDVRLSQVRALSLTSQGVTLTLSDRVRGFEMTLDHGSVTEWDISIWGAAAPHPFQGPYDGWNGTFNPLFFISTAYEAQAPDWNMGWNRDSSRVPAADPVRFHRDRYRPFWRFSTYGERSIVSWSSVDSDPGAWRSESAAAVPIPAAVALMAPGLIALAAVRRRFGK